MENHLQACIKNDFVCGRVSVFLTNRLVLRQPIFRGAATNIGLGEAGLKLGSFLHRKYEGGVKDLMVLHHGNNIEHNLKQNKYTDMEVISLVHAGC